MGYSRSPVTVEKRLSLLRPLFYNQPHVVWNSTLTEAPKLARQILECFYIAREVHRDKFANLAAIAERYEIQVQGPNVVAVLRATTGPASSSEIPKDVPEPVNIHKVPTLVSSAPQIIETWMNLQPFNGAIEFLNTQLTDEDRSMLTTWAANMELVVFFDETTIIRPKVVS